MNNIIHRGTLTKDKLKALFEEHFTIINEDKRYNPSKNEKAISIIQQEDGNWIGEAQKFGRVVTVRTNDPQIVLLGLLTHSGQQ